jgi:hypothetical protein
VTITGVKVVAAETEIANQVSEIELARRRPDLVLVLDADPVAMVDGLRLAKNRHELGVRAPGRADESQGLRPARGDHRCPAAGALSNREAILLSNVVSTLCRCLAVQDLGRHIVVLAVGIARD